MISRPMLCTNSVAMLLRYKAWANAITFRTLRTLPEVELLRPRATRFGNIVHTLNHVYVIDRIFRAHLEGRPHGYTARNTDSSPSLAALWEAVAVLDRWYLAYGSCLDEPALAEIVDFAFVDGGRGAMTRQEMLLHVVNHGTYHRGFVSDMLYQIPIDVPANDLTVFIRDARDWALA